VFRTAGDVSREPAVRDYAGSFDAYQYLAHLRRRFRFILIVCASAALAALIVSLLLPKQYTATATIAIDPPAGSDPRNSIAVNPVYFESLRAYELMASGDTLFLRAVDKFHLRDPQTRASLESLKRRILKVTKVRDTKILEIEVTLRDPKLAQAVAEFLARETVSLTRDSNLENDRDLLASAQERAQNAQKDLEQEQAAWRDFNTHDPYESIRAEVEALATSRERVERELLDARADLDEISSRNLNAQAARARVDSLEKQNTSVSRDLESKAKLLAGHEARARAIEQRVQAAQEAFDSAAARVHEIQSAAGTRGERLRVMDPGVVPERPSAPNVALNVALALLVALAASLTYLTLAFRPVG
jgi:uncharacterized protein involved in exopolysaccharide biosynthesis